MKKSEDMVVLKPVDESALPVERSAMDIATTRAAQEIQAAMLIAKKFPRDINQAYSRIMQACKRKGIAEAAEYAYPRGDKTVGGPSIRMAEVLAQNWGNMDFGIIELEQKRGESSVMSYAWDLETNARQTKVFTVKHERHTRQGTTFLSDPRDIYEMTANQGARRLRACILGVIPKDIVEDALAECNKTLESGHAEPLADRIRKMVAAFAEFGVNTEMIERRLQHRLDTTSETELVQLRKVYHALKDNMASVDSYFDRSGKSDASKDGQSKVKQMEAKLGAKDVAPKGEALFDNPADEHNPPHEPTEADLEKAARAGVLGKILKLRSLKNKAKAEKVEKIFTEQLEAFSVTADNWSQELQLDALQELHDNLEAFVNAQ